MQHNSESILVYQDEVHFTINTLITRKWFAKGSNPKVKSYPGRQKASYSGFLMPKSGKLLVDKPETFNYETTITSLRAFLAQNPLPEGKKFYIIMDNAPWHKKAKRLIKENLNGAYTDICSKVMFVYLPPYSPDLNPIEQVWRITRRERTHNRFFAKLADLSSSLDSYFALYKDENVKFQRLCGFEFTIVA